MSAQLILRALEMQDLQVLQALKEAAEPAVSSVSVTQRRELHTSARQFVVARRDQRLAGFLILLAREP